MPYRALYREWRPQDFSHMVGQKTIIETLRNQVVSGRIAHAYLFCGSRGTGKTSTAKILAKAVNCENPRNGDPCGECENCRRLEQEESLDVIEIDAASNNGVDEMRNLRDTVKYPPQFGKYKVYIIDEVHMLSTSAFNALLKTLEEPPAHIVFILATTEPQKLPETILSRCQRYDFGRLSVAEIQSRLQEAARGSGAEVSPGALMTIARAAEGGMRDALSLLDMCLGYGNQIDEKTVREILGTSDQSFLFSFAEALREEDAGSVFRMVDRLMMEGKDPIVFSKDVCRHIRTLLLAKCCPKELGEILDLTSEDTEEYRKQADTFTVSRLMKILELYISLETEMRYASSPRLALESISLKACIRTTETDQQALMDRIEEMQKEIDELRTTIRSGILPGEKIKVQTKTEPAGQTNETKTNAMKTGAEGSKKEKSSPENQNVWKELMNRFRKTDPGIWSLLTQGKITGCEGNIYIWQPDASEGKEFFIQPLNKEEKKSRIIQTLNEITGLTCGFEATTAEIKKPENNDLAEQSHLNELYRTFGKEPVDIVEHL